MNNNLAPEKLIAIMQTLLLELERQLQSAPTVNEGDTRSNQLKGQIDRLGVALHKRQDAERRRRDLEKQNKENSRSGQNG